MSKIQRPRAGGSYTRDPKSGKLTRDHHTKPAPGRNDAAAKKAAPAEEAPADAPEQKEA